MSLAYPTWMAGQASNSVSTACPKPLSSTRPASSATSSPVLLRLKSGATRFFRWRKNSMLRKFVFPLLLAAMLSPAFAKEAAPAAAAPAAEARLMKLASELRCLVCQNQTIADSNADLAVDLRNEIREKLESGMSDAEIKDFMVARYGDFGLYRPPLKDTTLILWVGPFLLLAAGGSVLYVTLRQRRQRAAEPELNLVVLVL